MQNGLNRLRELWQNTSRINQIMLVTAVVTALLVGIGFVYWAGTPDYTPLVSNASPTDANKIVGLLKEKKVAYRVTNSGTIEVPTAQRDELRMALAGAGLLESGSLGYGVLKEAPFGQTQAMEQEHIRQAHEGEMEKAIMSLEPVSSANVHFADADPNPFVEAKKREGSASIVVHVKPGSELTKENVRAIVGLVQSGYANISRKNMNLVDGEGRLLWNGAEEGEGMVGSTDRQTLERKYENDLTYRIQTHIKNTVGPGKSSVLVRVGLNLDRQTEKRQEVLPGLRTSRELLEETVTGVKSVVNAPQPPPGVLPNTTGAGTPTYAGADVKTGGEGKYSKNSTVETMANGTNIIDTVKAPGDTKYIFAAVSLDDTIPPVTVTALKQQIETIVGQDSSAPTKDVKVTVDTVKFDRSVQEAEKKSAEVAASSTRMNSLISYGVPLALMLVMLVILARSLRRPVPAGQLAITGGMRPALAGAGAGVGGNAGSGLNLLVGEDLPPGMTVGDALSGEARVVPVTAGEQVHTYEIISEQFDSNLESIIHLARSKPDTVAQLIKSWLAEEKR